MHAALAEQAAALTQPPMTMSAALHGRVVGLVPPRCRGPFAEGVGSVLRPEGNQLAEYGWDSHYGWGRRLYDGIGTRLGVQTVYLEITRGGAASD
jgi:hypothetical protein